MKTYKKILIAAVAVAAAMILTGCDGKTFQYTAGNRVVNGSDIQTFHYAYVRVGDDVVKGSVIQWRDYDDSDAVQVMLEDGKTYLTHYTNVTLIADPKLGSMGYSTGLYDYN